MISYNEHPDKESPMAMLSNGVQVPTEYLLEDWVLTDGDGKAIQGVFLMRDLSNEILQATVYRDLIYHNLTVDDEVSVKKSPRFQTRLWFPREHEYGL